MHDSFLRFLKACIAYSFEDAPHNFPFLEGVQPFLCRVPEEGEYLPSLLASLRP